MPSGSVTFSKGGLLATALLRANRKGGEGGGVDPALTAGAGTGCRFSRPTFTV